MTFEHRIHERCACGGIESRHAAPAPRPFPLAATSRVYERARPFRVEHVALDLTLDVEGKGLDGVAVIDVRRVDAAATTLVLDAVGLLVHEVVASTTASPPLPAEGAPRSRVDDGSFRAVPHVSDGETIRVTLPPEWTRGAVRVRWRATPRRGMYFLAPDDHVTDRPRQVWTQCQDEDARRIFPCHDKPHEKSTFDVRVRAPEGWTVLSNGTLASGDAGTGVFHWVMRKPMPSYLFTLVAGEFEVIEEKVGDLPLTYLFPRGRADDARRAFGRTPEMVRLFGEKTGVAYPYDKYAQVVVSDFTFGGMENTTATTMYEHVLYDERAAIDITSDDLVAHELAHHWFGDLVTCRDWSHGWLNEGFATYMESVDREAHKGRDEYAHGLLGELGNYVAEARSRYRRPVVCQDYELPIDLFDRHLYEKGGLVLHLLRTELGDGPFWSGVRDYLGRHAHGVVETRDLQRALEEASGRSLERFFEQWVHRPGHPELTVKAHWSEGALTVEVKQGQSTQPLPALAGEALAVPVFAFDLTVDLLDPDGQPTRHVLKVERASHTFAIGVPRRPAGLVIDAELRVLGEVEADLPGDWLRFTVRRAPTARGRVLAAQALARRNEPHTAHALREALLDEQEFWGVRAEAASTLGDLRTEEAFRALEEGSKVAHPKVRRAVATALGKYRTPAAAAALEPLALSDRSYLVEAAAARALGATRQPRAFDVLVELLERPSWAEVVRCGALDGLAALRDERAIPHLTAKLRYGVPPRARRAAILALAQLTQDRKAREALEEQLDDQDPHVLHDVIRALGEIGDARSRTSLSRLLDRDLDGRVRRKTREVLRDLLGPPRREAAALRDELDTLRKDHADLVARLGRMEVRLTPEAPAAGTVVEEAASDRRPRAAKKAKAKTSTKKKPSRTTPRATSGRDGGPRPHQRGLR